MAKYMEIETKQTEHITLYEKEDFDNAREQAVKAIDAMIDYLNSIREDVVAFEPNDVYREDRNLGKYSNGFNRNNILDKIRDTIYTPEYEEYGELCDPSGYCANILKWLSMTTHIGWNLYNQEKYSGRIEECYWHFH